MGQRIIYPTESGGVAVIIPFLASGIPLEEIARKDVPNGWPYLIVDVAAISADRTFRDAWEADSSNPDGFGIGARRWFIEQVDAQISHVESTPAPVFTAEDFPELGDDPTPEMIAEAAAPALALCEQAKQAILTELHAKRAELVAELLRTEGVSE